MLITASDQKPSSMQQRLSQPILSCTFSYHTWQFTIFTITACIYSYSLSISF